MASNSKTKEETNLKLPEFDNYSISREKSGTTESET